MINPRNYEPYDYKFKFWNNKPRDCEILNIRREKNLLEYKVTNLISINILLSRQNLIIIENFSYSHNCRVSF